MMLLIEKMELNFLQTIYTNIMDISFRCLRAYQF